PAHDELIRRADQPLDPRRRCPALRLSVPPARHDAFVVLDATAPRRLAVEGRLRLVGENERHRLAGAQRGPEGRRVEMVLERVQAALALAGEMEAVVPGVRRRRGRAARKQPQRTRTWKGRDLPDVPG